MKLGSLLHQSDVEAASTLATPTWRLAELAQHEDDEVRWQVANNPRTSVETLIDLASDLDCDVRCAVASHAKSPVHILESLARDPAPGVRGHVAANPRCIPATLAWLAQDYDASVRLEAAGNRGTPLELLLELEEGGADFLERLFSNGTFPDEKIEGYAFADDPEARRLAAASGRLDDNVMHHLAYDEDARVRLAVAADPATPVEALNHLLESELVLLGELIGFPDSDPFSDPASGDWMAFTYSEAIQLAVASNPAMPLDELRDWFDLYFEGNEDETELDIVIRSRIEAADDFW